MDGRPLIRIDNPYDIILQSNNNNYKKKPKKPKKLNKPKEIIEYYSAENYKSLGNEEFNKKNFNEAINFYSKAI